MQYVKIINKLFQTHCTLPAAVHKTWKLSADSFHFEGGKSVLVVEQPVCNNARDDWAVLSDKLLKLQCDHISYDLYIIMIQPSHAPVRWQSSHTKARVILYFYDRLLKKILRFNGRIYHSRGCGQVIILSCAKCAFISSLLFSFFQSQAAQAVQPPHLANLCSTFKIKAPIPSSTWR